MVKWWYEMNEIKKLDNKYFVVKIEDVKLLSLNGQNRFEELLTHIEEKRKLKGKKQNNYVVLNLDDTINLDYLIRKCEIYSYNQKWNNFTEYENTVKQIAIDLVNAILITKEVI